MRVKTIIKIVLIILLMYQSYLYSNTLNIAVSSNFLRTLKIIVEEFEKKNSCKIIISSDSTANLFTKINNGAPFDIFISADAKHPIMLENNIFESTVYAYGKLVLWQEKSKIKKNMLIGLSKDITMSIANPNLSPYGLASKNVFTNIKIKNKNIILGANINYVFKFVYSKNSDIGIVALSHIAHNKIQTEYFWKIAKYLYPTIEQRMIILNNENSLYLKKKFIRYMKKNSTRRIIDKYGYKLKK